MAKQLSVWLAVIISDLITRDFLYSLGMLVKAFCLKKWRKKHAEIKFMAILEKARSMKETPLTMADLALMLSQQSNTQKMFMNMTAFILFEIRGCAVFR